MPIYLGLMTLPKSLVAVLAMLTLCLFAGCSVQKRTTAAGWHVEKESGFFRLAGPSSSLTPQVKTDPPTLTRMNRLPPSAVEWTTSAFPVDTSVVDAKVKKKVRSALRREIRMREDLLMFPNRTCSTCGKRYHEAEKWHDRAEQICKEQEQFLNEVAPDEFARLESLRDPSRETMQELKRKKRLTIWALILAPFILLVVPIALLLPLIAGGLAIQG